MSTHHKRDGTKFHYTHVVGYVLTKGESTITGVPWGMEGFIWTIFGIGHEWLWKAAGYKVQRVER